MMRIVRTGMCVLVGTVSVTHATEVPTWATLSVVGDGMSAAIHATTDDGHRLSTLLPPEEGQYCGGLPWTVFASEIPVEGFVTIESCGGNVKACVADFPDMSDAICATVARSAD